MSDCPFVQLEINDFGLQILHDTKFFFLNASSQLLDVFFFLAGFLLSWNIIRRRNQDKETPFLFVIFYRCVTVSWFISTDFQLFLVSLFVVYLAEKYPKYRTAVLSTAFVVSHVVPSLIIYVKNEKSFWMASVSDVQDVSHAPYIREYYVKFYMRSPPYIYGLCGGYMVNALMKRKFKATGTQNVFLFLIFMPLNILMFYIGATFLRSDVEYNVWQHVVFAFVLRFVLATGLFLLVLLHMCGGCVHLRRADLKEATYVNVHSKNPELQFYLTLVCGSCLFVFLNGMGVYDQDKVPEIQTLRTFGDILMSVLLSLVTTLLFESPIGILRKKYLNI
ncbi:uncharacterized protein LOC113467273 [Diaphorina citri]|uniref:Uncharacterized protein LOC113467273 n=1 Tax=Diaphorina citri TaxID=121845 RepID=A0A3Q0IXM4_DIACI|nr:uncharacterized protein LOC113467273 [Diaphorina citri]